MKMLCVFLLGLLLPLKSHGQGSWQRSSDSTTRVQNPILPGFHPDPSIVRVGATYYMACSSFEFWPGIPLYKSKDLAHWELIGHVAERKSQVDMAGLAPSKGFYAPTLRYYNGQFYALATYVTDTEDGKRFRNMLFTTADPAGDWSEPHILTDGTDWKIDPDLFLDDDGKAYFTANVQQEAYPDVGWRRAIRMQELNLKTMELVGQPKIINKGALKDAVAVEAPHLYKKDGYYYLLVSEGGTGAHHAVSVFRSKDVWGPYELYGANPILTHRHLGHTVEIRNVGHADLVQSPEGRWWMVCLGVRKLPDIGSPLGRETFLVPVEWPKGGYPIPSPGVGRVTPEVQLASASQVNEPLPFLDEFEAAPLPAHWNQLRNTRQAGRVAAGQLVLPLRKATLKSRVTPSWVGRRLQHYRFTATTRMAFQPHQQGERAGLSLMLDDQHYLHFTLGQTAKGQELQLRKGTEKGDTLLASSRYQGGGDSLFLRVYAPIAGHYRFSYSEDGKQWRRFYEEKPSRYFNTPWWIFTGTYVGVYASSSGQSSSNQAQFEWFFYSPLE